MFKNHYVHLCFRIENTTQPIDNGRGDCSCNASNQVDIVCHLATLLRPENARPNLTGQKKREEEEEEV